MIGIGDPAVLVEREQAVGQPLGGLRRGDPARRVDERPHQEPARRARPYDMPPQTR
ncbi:hypothetical protein [Streptomyces sp. P9-A2]|uniref:hypothetical protein n=1 Tax=Streptomyces sp. P9-A2 TaxID=3072284 RepID=UPI002FC7240B